NEEKGSWKIICMCGRRSRSADSGSAARSTVRPSILKSTDPAVGVTARRRQRAIVVLPDPDSPTIPRVSPGIKSKLMSSTAFTWPTTRRVNPLLRIGKCLQRPRTRSSGVTPFAAAPASEPDGFSPRALPVKSLTMFGLLDDVLRTVAGNQSSADLAQLRHGSGVTKTGARPGTARVEGAAGRDAGE